MRTAAIIENEQMVNSIVFTDATAAGLMDAYGDAFVEITDQHPQPGLGAGWTYVDGAWNPPPPPYPSWTWNGTKYEAPVPRPQGVNYAWDEEAQEWVYFGPPQPTIIQD